MAASDRVEGVDETTTQIGSSLRTERLAGRPLQQLIEQVVRRGDVIAGVEGYDCAALLCSLIQEFLARFLRGKPGMKYFLGLRHLSPRLWVDAFAKGHDISAGARNTAELAVHRFGNWSASPISSVDSVTWSVASLAQVARALAFSEAYANLMSAQRRVAKAQSLQVVSTAPLMFVAETSQQSAELDDLIQRRDRRATRGSHPLASVGVLAPATSNVIEDDVGLLSAEWIHAKELVPSFLDGAPMPLERLTDGTDIWIWERIARWGFIPDVGRRRAKLLPYDAALRAEKGFGVIDLDAVLHYLTVRMLNHWTPPVVPRSLDQFGYLVLDQPWHLTLSDVIEMEPYAGYHAASRPTPESLAAAFNYLDASRQNVPLSSPLQFRPLRTLNDGTLLYDALHVTQGGALLWGVTVPERVRDEFARNFERDVHAELGFAPQPWPSGKAVRVEGRQFTDVDASVMVDDILVVVDCYRSPWSSALDEGSHTQTRNRAQHVIDKLRSWDDKWRSIVSDYRNVLPPEVSAVFPVVVTSNVEWIASAAADLWISRDVPRILTTEELVDVLRRTSGWRRLAIRV